ncbi:zinc finger CW-type PWWP domain protein 2-like isoform X1 [Alosa sapidissima]|uniref:zinc finger CW-type PWWP domain protein 2-like isoform X1 n=1 Tax=Alosa sapidissima TaxID=34773 RepID=UPI001C099BDA|nr:zinc finger CW-type PWWP domain protein 2-like isoform X1 [Alosa sapidissima]XP_041962822.1 zinc finger CW-type PWWP domain protein 2-like isoform X1 [Alosa sapidissima]XP_041962823.1 zinc finger CW-type PWWP domain protein 2-like isoform X1 [Alosa sapidissima]XP_041962824.1 zinc finger CW-type PWWP domain protein 2-like isoform X1 [Alosa sapidissima]
MDYPDQIVNEDEATFLSKWIWVQCESPNCLKWRLISKHDKLDLDEPWFCHMNPDPCFSQCIVPQSSNYKDSTLRQKGLKVIYSKLPAGSLVLVKASKWPLWPAILSTDPSYDEYVTYDEDGDVEQYHVEFLGTPHSRFWALAPKVEPFRLLPANAKCLKGVLKQSYKIAMEEAMGIQDMSCEERLQLCHFKPEECGIQLMKTCVSAVLFQAKGLMQSIEKMITDCAVETKSKHSSTTKRQGKMKVNQETSDGSIMDIGDTLFVEGFRFESAASVEELRQLNNRDLTKELYARY